MNIKGPYVLPAAFFGEKSTAQTQAEIVSIPAYISPLWYSSGLTTDALSLISCYKHCFICLDIKVHSSGTAGTQGLSQVTLHLIQGRCRLWNIKEMKIVLVTLP